MLRTARIAQIFTGQVGLPRRGSRVAWLLGRGNVESDRESFFAWQERVLDLMLSWGIGNIAAGSVIAWRKPGIARAIAVQAIGWGVVDTAIAAYAGCVARRHATSARAGLYGARHIRQRAQRFEQLLAIQTGADIVYVTLGSIVASRAKSDWVKGTAIGVVIQGGALLLYDAGLVIRLLTRPELRYEETARE